MCGGCQTKISDMLDEDETETNQQGGEDEEDEEDDEGTCPHYMDQ